MPRLSNASEVHEVYLSLGSNLGSRIHHLDDAIRALKDISVGPIICSKLYETTPVGYLNQPDFLNIVVHLSTRCTARELLTYTSDIENSAGRVRTIRFGPRQVDIDILLFDDDYYCFQDLQIPHPRMWSRSFVLIPLADIVPHRRGLGGLMIRELAFHHRQEGDVRYVGDFW